MHELREYNSRNPFEKKRLPHVIFQEHTHITFDKLVHNVCARRSLAWMDDKAGHRVLLIELRMNLNLLSCKFFVIMSTTGLAVI